MLAHSPEIIVTVCWTQSNQLINQKAVGLTWIAGHCDVAPSDCHVSFLPFALVLVQLLYRHTTAQHIYLRERDLISNKITITFYYFNYFIYYSKKQKDRW